MTINTKCSDTDLFLYYDGNFEKEQEVFWAEETLINLVTNYNKHTAQINKLCKNFCWNNTFSSVNDTKKIRSQKGLSLRNMPAF